MCSFKNVSFVHEVFHLSSVVVKGGSIPFRYAIIGKLLLILDVRMPKSGCTPDWSFRQRNANQNKHFFHDWRAQKFKKKNTETLLNFL